MARAAFVVDRVMGRIGLEGRCLRVAAVLLRLRGARHHGDAHDPVAARPARHDPGRAADDLLGAAAGLRAADRRLRARRAACWGPLGLQGLVLLGLYLLGARRGAGAWRRVLKRTLLARRGPALLHGAADLPAADRCGSGSRQVWGSARAFLRRAGHDHPRRRRSCSGCCCTFPRVEAPPGARRPRPARYALEHSVAGRIGHAIEPADRAARLRLEDRRRPGREPRRARGDRRDARPDLRGRGRGGLAARGGARATSIRAPGEPRLHARDRGVAARLLRLRAAVHVDARGDAARDQLLALAGLRLRLPARAGLRRELRDPPAGRLTAHVLPTILASFRAATATRRVTRGRDATPGSMASRSWVPDRGVWDGGRGTGGSAGHRAAGRDAGLRARASGWPSSTMPDLRVDCAPRR